MACLKHVFSCFIGVLLARYFAQYLSVWYTCLLSSCCFMLLVHGMAYILILPFCLVLEKRGFAGGGGGEGCQEGEKGTGDIGE